ncbi:hypothetical protein LTR08_002531 [Meristemomyces frigidus]|nr:hypothetical protein LTR08_002531 [Meristemomyces frigidus]
MAGNTAPLSYSAALSSGSNSNTTTTSAPAPRQQAQPPPKHEQHTPHPAPRAKRAPSPPHKPHTASPNEPVYILTLQTSAPLHAHMTALRTRYFPAHLNKLSAHLTLFHALPESKLRGTVIPSIQNLVQRTQRFELRCGRAFALKKGIAIAVERCGGGARAQGVQRVLRDAWGAEGWLSEQDAGGGGRVHYTVMNKVDDAAVVAAALAEVQREFEGEVGWAEGLGLWRYERGYWVWVEGFSFSGGGDKGREL